MLTEAVIRQKGMDALISTLGYVDAERFLVLISREPFDYTKWREEHLSPDPGGIRALSRKAQDYSKTVK